jgi:fructosamine-3-kinase
MFRCEAEGLKLLGSSAFRIPEVISYGNFESWSYLILEHIDNQGNTMNQHEFGQKLAQLHLQTDPKFGLGIDNYIGSLTQLNKREDTWATFYGAWRLNPLIKMAYDQKMVESKMLKSIENLYNELHNLIPNEVPALLHGDLWQGNLICDEHSGPILIDPAVYYGHREMDLAMLQLFGSISPDTLEAYNNTYPLQKDWEKRIDIHQLYPLLVHLILFGESYLGEIKRIVQKYT